MARRFFHRETGGIRVTVRPLYLPDHSRPARSEFVFAYFVRLENVGEVSAQLVWRNWHIHDDIGEDTEIQGEGVLGEQPVLEPGGVHEYQSFCVLRSPSGWMDGAYTLTRPGGDRFEALIPRIDLQMATEGPVA
ncbi:MAG TPA: Co2+/Mg2+ efflux protein ApaG [Gemmatimonadales bacterium]|nr:Co2+/Mg2+ efflux protein ApaG [Gemmatimonadales bacterium]